MITIDNLHAMTKIWDEMQLPVKQTIIVGYGGLPELPHVHKMGSRMKFGVDGYVITIVEDEAPEIEPTNGRL